MKTDKFWAVSWGIIVLCAGVSFLASLTLFVIRIHSVDAAAVGITFDPTKDPFEQRLNVGTFHLTDGYIYRDALPLGLQKWNWDARVDWSSSEQVKDGQHSAKITFNNDWAGMGVSGFSVAKAAYQSLSFDVYVDTSVGDLYIEVYNGKGTALVRQSVGWYATGGTLMPNTWQVITIPIENLMGGDSSDSITGISISTTHPGVAFVDNIQFTNIASAHPVWVAPLWQDIPPFNPFATSTPASLPYKLESSGESLDRWYSYNGFFENRGTSFKIGPLSGRNTDSFVVYRGGKNWDDYQVDTVSDWGLTSTMSIMVRVKDPLNYASCAYSYYGQTAQIYDVVNGVSTMSGQTPALATRNDAPWENVHTGVKVQGNEIYCLVDGVVVLKAELTDMPRVGTVGIDAWDKNTYSSPHTVKKLDVLPLGGE
jgi:hypothetical protein